MTRAWRSGGACIDRTRRVRVLRWAGGRLHFERVIVCRGAPQAPCRRLCAFPLAGPAAVLLGRRLALAGAGRADAPASESDGAWGQTGRPILSWSLPRGAARAAAAGWHTVTPEEDYRTALLSDSPDEGVRYASAARGRGNDPDAKPACGTPRARRSAAGSFHPLGKGSWSRDANEGLLGRPEAPMPHARNRAARRRRQQQKQTNEVFSRGRSPA
jgi:hypothetical protein